MPEISSYGDDSPITAFATTPGSSALTLIRCSGNGALNLAEKIFSEPEKLRQTAGNTVLHGWIVAANEKIDEVLISVFRSPKSYTGEDSLDISCHGGIAAGKGVMAALRDCGFRDALPGEFTFRAFMNGKLDLTRCESVMELVSARTDKGRGHAINRLSGVLEHEINATKKQLVQALSGVEIFLDYCEDEISAPADEAAGHFSGQRLVQETLARLRKLAQSWQRERIYQEGILAAIAGRPNAGKSSLFNLLLKEERSIVTEIPGTTRDWIEAAVSLEGIPLRFADTAGLRESLDPVEKIGVERSRDLLESAELILYLIDGTAGVTGEDRAFITGNRPPSQLLLIIWNKADIVPMPTTFPFTANGPIGVSAKTGEGIAELESAIVKTIEERLNTADEQPVSAAASLGTIRQKNLVEAVAAALEEALVLAERKEPLDLIAPLLREAVNSLGEITGEVSTADILEEMFSKFCVGK
ncbi:MAG: tRNA uridine-5-carboxymethylaminomethyl(34) synthesis GTPase MnmE [Treponema sp.]|jgi:tRNA modification GTPase|nr:tRNA uridine-5-carboxymethylaminomethyl(34) synthesis GTPase MnmE [Treponema sp.]